MTYKRLVPTLLGLLIVSATGLADSLPISMEYFGMNTRLPQRVEALPPSIHFTDYNVDAQRNLEKQLSADLPANVDDATKIVQQRMAGLAPNTLPNLFKSVVTANNYGLTKLPAVVFNHGDAVIYGVDDVSLALELWQHPDKWLPPTAKAGESGQ